MKRLVLPPSIRHVNAEHCELLSIRLCLPYDQQHKITYLNLNDNPELYCVVNFDVNTIDTLLTSNCANGYPLIKLLMNKLNSSPLSGSRIHKTIIEGRVGAPKPSKKVAITYTPFQKTFSPT